MKTWNILLTLKTLEVQLKQKVELPDYVVSIAESTAAYESDIAALWDNFKKNPTEDNALLFINELENLADEDFEKLFLDLLDEVDLSDRQRAYLEEQVSENKGYMRTSLMPDIIKGIKSGQTDFSNMDYRVLALYSGALWSFGFMSTVMWDGLEMRDAADLFIFAGPDDEETCTGERGCDQHVGKVYTVAQILAENIIPGKLKCLTNCRHMLIPIASPLGE